MASLGQPNVDLVDAGVLPETVPQAVEVVEAAPVAELARNDEATPPEIAQPFHLGVAAIEATTDVPVRDQPIAAQRVTLGFRQIRELILDGAHKRGPGIAAACNPIRVGDPLGLCPLSLGRTVEDPQPQRPSNKA